MTYTDEDGEDSEIDVVCGGENEGDDEVADDAEGGKGWQEAKI
jgi:hypothetical protein